MEIRKFKVKIQGIRPLLMSRFPSEEWKVGSPLPEGGKLKDEEDYKRAFEKSKYLTEDGKLYTPASHIHGSMIIAAGRVPISARGSYRNLVESGIFVMPEEIIHLKQKCEMDVRNAVNRHVFPPAAIITCRARLEKWELEFEIHCIDKRGKESDLRQILEIAGAYIGIGAYRPRYGRFEIVEWKKV